MKRLILEIIVLAVSLTTQLSAQTQTVNGNLYSETVEVAGRTLTLVGAGLRERWWFDIYTMGAYVESHTCNPQILTSVDEVKFLRIDLLRDVEAKSMARVLEDAFEKNLPTEDRSNVRLQINTALSYFKKDLGKGDSMELTYTPGVGTAIIQNSEQQGFPTFCGTPISVPQPAVPDSKREFSPSVPGEEKKMVSID